MYAKYVDSDAGFMRYRLSIIRENDTHFFPDVQLIIHTKTINEIKT